MKKISRKNLAVIKSINENGYCIIKDFFDKKKLSKVKQSHIRILQYIHPDNEKDLQKKYSKNFKITENHTYSS